MKRGKIARPSPIATMDYYLDQNVYDHFLLELGLSVDEIAAVMKDRKIRLILSEHNIHETVSCWKSGATDKIKRGQKILQLQLDLQPVRFLLPTPLLIKYEIAPLIGNYVPGPFLDSKSEALTRADLGSLASGQLQKGHSVRLENGWSKKQSETKHYEELRQQGFFGQLHSVEPFEAFIAKNRKAVKYLAEHTVSRHLNELGERERKKTAKIASSRLRKCPALRAAVRANMFLAYRLSRREKSRHDLWDDLCHSISAVYSNVFVTGDVPLSKRLLDINPQLIVKDHNQFAKDLGIL